MLLEILLEKMKMMYDYFNCVNELEIFVRNSSLHARV